MYIRSINILRNRALIAQGRGPGRRPIPLRTPGNEGNDGRSALAFPESPGLAPVVSPVRFPRDAYASRWNRQPAAVTERNGGTVEVRRPRPSRCAQGWRPWPHRADSARSGRNRRPSPAVIITDFAPALPSGSRVGCGLRLGMDRSRKLTLPRRAVCAGSPAIQPSLGLPTLPPAFRACAQGTKGNERRVGLMSAFPE